MSDSETRASENLGDDPFGPDPFELGLQVMTDVKAGVVIVKVRARARSGWIEGTGTAKVGPGDVFDPVVGRYLAQSRAFADLSIELGRRAADELEVAEREQVELREWRRYELAADRAAYEVSDRVREVYDRAKDRNLIDPRGLRSEVAFSALSDLLVEGYLDPFDRRRDASVLLRLLGVDRADRLSLLSKLGLAGPSRWSGTETDVEELDEIAEAGL